MGVKLTAPHSLRKTHDLSQFNSGQPSLDEWLRRRALANERSQASRTFVTTNGDVVVGYYSLAAGSISHKDSIRKARTNMPNPIPAIILGRLAVDQSLQGEGVGPSLLKDAVLRTWSVSREVGIKVLLVHALNSQARDFYLSKGFKESPLNETTLMLLIEEISKNMQKT